MSAMEEARSEVVKLGELELHFLDWGDRDAPPVLFLHGFAGHAWQTIFPAQSLAHDHWVIALDQRGHGDSAWADVYGSVPMVADAVAFLDWLCGEFLDWMEARGLLENLVIAFCSDHGNHLGDFGLLQKQTFFDPSVNVPYLFWAPDRIGAGRVFETPVGITSTRRGPIVSSARPIVTRPTITAMAMLVRNRLRGETPSSSAYSAEKLVNAP